MNFKFDKMWNSERNCQKKLPIELPNKLLKRLPVKIAKKLVKEIPWKLSDQFSKQLPKDIPKKMQQKLKKIPTSTSKIVAKQISERDAEQISR